MEEKKITCVICPNSCGITVKFQGETVYEVTGHNCERGVTYASQEAVNPVRSVSTTVRCKNGRIVAVKTTIPVPKENVYDVMWDVNHFKAPDDIKYGDIIMTSVGETNADIVVISD